jgi:transcriptional regulator with XRE-family HTH domain
MSAINGHSITINQGRNLKRFREMMGIKQETLAFELGEEWTQKRISILEAKETIENQVLEEIAAVLKIPAEAIRNFDESKALQHIRESYCAPALASQSHSQTFNPLEKLMETLDALILLHKENINLYERLLMSEQEKVALLKAIQASDKI